ncbi:hypothetical protein SADUNF_Sadunf19G0000700 [Salix dunnii]|uniref:Uncharacterized protein n=1 Tax=Salix dunnii TaxID=1413687 RepID=A0A835J313_9ROSI|nr:hypothetical protein SADUNF_Sadunf19G0000700 [Salix dunnii]
MEGVPPSSMDDDVNQLDVDRLISELLLSPPEGVPENQSSISCNDQAGQHTLVDNNDSIQQTTQFPASFPQTMTTMGGLDGTSSSWINQNGPNWPQTASSDQQWTNQLAMSNQVPGMLPQPPMKQCSRQFPYQFNQVPITPNLYDPQCSTMLPEPSQTLRSPPEEVPVNQARQNMQVDSIQQTTQFPASFPQTMTTMGGLDGTSSSWINQHGPNWPQTAPSDQQWTNQLAMSNQVPGMLPQPPMNQCSRQFPYQSNQVPITPNLYDPQCSTMLPEPSQTLRSPQSPPHNLQVSGDNNQGQNENHSSGPDSSLQSQNRGLNTQQVRALIELSPIANCLL